MLALPWQPCPGDLAPAVRFTRGRVRTPAGRSTRVGEANAPVIRPRRGSVLVAVARPAGQPFAVALAIMLVLALIGLVIAVLIPRQSTEAAQQADPSTAAAR